MKAAGNFGDTMVLVKNSMY